MDTSDYSALHACVKNDAVEVAKLLLDGGMDFEGYQQWAAARHYGGYEETIQALADHWAELQAAMEPESVSQQTGGTSPVLLAKAGLAILNDERTRKAAGWAVVAVLSPIILLVAFFCALGSGTSEHSVSAVELCFYGGALPANTPEEYRACIEQMQEYFTQLDRTISAVNGQTENGASLDDIRIKAIFYALYFGAERQLEDTLGPVPLVCLLPRRGSSPSCGASVRAAHLLSVGYMKFYLEQVVGKNIKAGFPAAYRLPAYPKGKPDGECSMPEYVVCPSFTGTGAERRKIVYKDES